MSGPHSRPGKTMRDKISGTYARHLRNQEARREWNKAYSSASKAGGRKVIPYPQIGR